MLKVGITVSDSIPVAVISLSLFRIWSKFGGGRDATILENNIVQTAGSAGESIAFGVGVTMPDIMILGYDLEMTRVMLVALLGGWLGILMMIPLRRALIVQQHGELKYPEGTACAEVLKAGAAAGVKTGSGGAAIFTGFGVGLVYKAAMSAFKAWKDTPEKIFGAPFNGGSISADISPELLGVGYVIGPRISAIMAAGGVLSYLVLIPLIKFFGQNATAAIAPGAIPIKDMAPDQVRGAYILYIGAGAVAAGGIISLGRSLPLIWRGIRAGIADFGASARRTRRNGAAHRTGSPYEICRLRLSGLGRGHSGRPLPANEFRRGRPDPGLRLSFRDGLVADHRRNRIVLQPHFRHDRGDAHLDMPDLPAGRKERTGLFCHRAFGGRIVCVAASNGGTTSQDLKTGFLLGSTPRLQQIAILIGAAASAVALAPILLSLNSSGTVYVPPEKNAPVLRAPAGTKFDGLEKLHGPQKARDRIPGRPYHVWHKKDDAGARSVKYLVDDSGAVVYLVDPGINGENQLRRPDGTKARKYPVPKAVLMADIIQGLLGGKNALGAGVVWHYDFCRARTLRHSFAGLCRGGLSSAFLLLAFVGRHGIIRWLVEFRRRRREPCAARG